MGRWFVPLDVVVGLKNVKRREMGRKACLLEMPDLKLLLEANLPSPDYRLVNILLVLVLW